jgi:hypothetical protein
MFYSRRINPETQTIEVWECEWSNQGTGMAKKRFLRKLGDEDDIDDLPELYSTADAVCWAPGRTIGNIAVSSEAVLGMFEAQSGDDALLPCHIVPCGKFRNGRKRWYCKTHQMHWGVQADYAAASQSGDVLCSNHLARMSYVVNPLDIEFRDYEEIGIWCSLPPALSSQSIARKSPKIHVHKRFRDIVRKLIDSDYDAIVCSYREDMGLFESPDITRIQVTPPAAFEFVRSLEEGRAMACVTCKLCGYPHLDLGDFARNPHRKHFCGNCGNDSIWSRTPIVSTPLRPLHDRFSNSNTYVVPDRTIDLDAYSGHEFELWSSTPAVLWTADRPQEKGIHVHVTANGRRVIDDTFGTVVYQGQPLDRRTMWDRMVSNTLH